MFLSKGIGFEGNWFMLGMSCFGSERDSGLFGNLAACMKGKTRTGFCFPVLNFKHILNFRYFEISAHI